MCQIEVIIRLKETEGQQVIKETELSTHSFDLLDIDTIARDERVDRIEEATMRQGWQIMRQLYLKQWQVIEQKQLDDLMSDKGSEAIRLDGKESLKIFSRLGKLELPRQVCFEQATGAHIIPLNELLPVHYGPLTTRGLQEWACLLPQELPFRTAQRLLGWLTYESEVVSYNHVRNLVQAHGEAIRQAEAADIKALQAHSNIAGLKPNMVPGNRPRRRPDWPEELCAAVDKALANPESPPPGGISSSDWERVLTYQRQTAAELGNPEVDLARLGPQVRPQQVVVATDSVEVRRQERRRWLALRTARVTTAQGYRYVSGQGDSFLSQLMLLLLICRASGLSWITLLGDGALWIRNFFKSLSGWARQELILDWYHLKHKCYELSSMICRGLKAKKQLLEPLLLDLWRGRLDTVLARLSEYRSEAKREDKLDELLGYLKKNQTAIPDYHDRRAQCLFIGSGHAEKANDLLVARRQKHKGMHWEQKSSDALCALKTLILNNAWDTYWLQRQVPSLAIA
jgi:hypothetical protein